LGKKESSFARALGHPPFLGASFPYKMSRVEGNAIISRIAMEKA